MKHRVLAHFGALGLLLAWLANGQSARAGDPSRPQIIALQLDGQTLVVTVQVPPGLRKLTLESRSHTGAGAWVPRVVERLDGTGGRLTFRLPATGPLALLRVRADAQEPLPASFYAGPTEFSGPVSSVPGAPGSVFRGDATESGTPGAEISDGPREVVESDIWRLRGHTLYFFNQYRGLQVLDLSDPDAPVVRGTLPLPAVGEQLYVVRDPQTGADRVVLLARNGCAGWGGGTDCQILIVDPAGGAEAVPRILHRLELSGILLESRLVGSALYVATQTSRQHTLPPERPEAEPVIRWEYGTQIQAFDLGDPGAPRPRDPLWFSGYGHTLQATDRYLFVVLYDPSDWWRSTVRLVDISAPDGTLKLAGEVRPAGRVADKFKLHLDGEVFTVISEVNRWQPERRQVSVLETFSLADPLQPRRLGQLEVGHGEGLYATRFDGQRAYLVTFLRVDPLWVVDLRDPTQPRVFGELEVPGWSTYIHPLGNRLITIGIEDLNSWRVAVSLFDVSDPARPALLSRVPLGEHSSWSEATHDEKAFAVLPDAGLILVPYQSWGEAGQAARVQLIDLGADSLTARGVIEHAFQPRRATVHGERIISVSGRELLSVDAGDRDHPRVAAELELSWPVREVLPVGDHLVEVSDTGGWFAGESRPVLRVVRADAPEVVRRRATLEAGQSLLGVAASESALFVVQSTPGVARPAAEDDPPVVPPDRVRVTAFDLAHLPELHVLGTAEAEVASLGWAPHFKSLWPRPGVLVLAGRGWGWGWWREPIGIGLDVLPAGPAGRPWWGGGSAGRLLAFDVANPAAPRLAADVDLGREVQGWFDGEPLVAGGLVYLSHQASEFRPGVTVPGVPPPPSYEMVHPDGTREKVTPPAGVWVTRHFLDVVDYADPDHPTVRPPVNLPGRLEAVAAAGELIFTRGPHWNELGQTDGVDYLDACAYDGVSVSLVASLRLPSEWPQALAVNPGGQVFLTRLAPADSRAGVIETWQLDAEGKFQRVAQTALARPATGLKSLDPLLAATTDEAVHVLLHNPDGLLLPLGEARLPGCLWPDLDRSAARPGQALWLPLGDYGLLTVPLPAAP